MARQGQSRGQRSVDWTVGDASWPTDVTDVPTLQVTTPPSLAAIGLTAWQSEISPGLGPQVFEPAEALTVMRIKGQIHYEIDTLPDATTWGATADLRFRIGEGDAALGGLPTLPASYDLRDTTWANEAFLWHHTVWTTNYGTWVSGTEQIKGYRETIPVDVKVQRRLEEYQQLQLVVQMSTMFGPLPGQRFRFYPQLRVLYLG